MILKTWFIYTYMCVCMYIAEEDTEHGIEEDPEGEIVCRMGTHVRVRLFYLFFTPT